MMTELQDMAELQLPWEQAGQDCCPQHHRGAAGFTLGTEEIPAAALGEPSEMAMPAQDAPELLPQTSTNHSCSRAAVLDESLAEAVLGTQTWPWWVPRWVWYSHRGGPKSTVSRALSCSFCRWLRSVIFSTVPIMVALFTASLHNGDKTLLWAQPAAPAGIRGMQSRAWSSLLPGQIPHCSNQVSLGHSAAPFSGLGESRKTQGQA